MFKSIKTIIVGSIAVGVISVGTACWIFQQRRSHPKKKPVYADLLAAMTNDGFTIEGAIKGAKTRNNGTIFICSFIMTTGETFRFALKPANDMSVDSHEEKESVICERLSCMDLGPHIIKTYGVLTKQMLIASRDKNGGNFRSVIATNFLEGGIGYVLMEYTPDGDLMKLIQSGTMSLSEKLRHCKDLADGVACLHMNWCIHRDLKPPNVLLVNGVLKICDFDTLIIMDHFLGKKVFRSGTLCFTAPEVKIQKDKDGKYQQLIVVDQKLMASDIWSLGLILIMVIAGSVTFLTTESGRESKHLKQIQAGNVLQALEDLGFTGYFEEDLLELIVKMLDIDPTRRATIDDVVTAFSEAPVVPPRVPPVKPLV